MSTQAWIDRRRERRAAERAAHEEQCRALGLNCTTKFHIIPTEEAGERGVDEHYYIERSAAPLTGAQVQEIIAWRGGDPDLSSATIERPVREERGREIAKRGGIEKVGTYFSVPSQSGGASYLVDLADEQCTCPDHEARKLRCKHVEAVYFWLIQEDAKKTCMEDRP